jgi:hypothetical protein
MAATLPRANRDVLIWGAGFSLAAIWPLLLPGYPPFQDLPNHVARVFVLLHPDDPALSAHFSIEWKAIPDLAWDVFGVLVGRWLPLDVTVKLFILLSMGLTLGGLFLLNRALVGRWTWAPLLFVPFLFNSGYTKGFLSFNFAVGLALVACACWAFGSEARWGRRLALASVLSTVLFFSHLLAWGCYGVFALCFELGNLVTAWRRDGPRVLPGRLAGLARDGLQALPPLLIVAMAALSEKGGYGLAGVLGEFTPPWDRVAEIYHIMDVGAAIPSQIFLAVVGPLALLLLVARKARLVWRRTLAIPVFLALMMAMPNEIFDTHFVVWRFGLFAVLLAFACAIPLEDISSRAMRVVLAVFLATTLCLSGWIAHAKAISDAAHAEFAQLIGRVPAGSTLFVEHLGISLEDIGYDQLGTFHIGSFAVIERRIMSQNLFANPVQQPIRYREPAFAEVTLNDEVLMEYLVHEMNRQGLSVPAHLAAFDWLVLHGPRPDLDAHYVPGAVFAPAGAIGAFRLYCRTHRAPSTGSGPLCPDGQPP